LRFGDLAEGRETNNLSGHSSSTPQILLLLLLSSSSSFDTMSEKGGVGKTQAEQDAELEDFLTNRGYVRVYALAFGCGMALVVFIGSMLSECLSSSSFFLPR
jgi:hypothetical protein